METKIVTGKDGFEINIKGNIEEQSALISILSNIMQTTQPKPTGTAISTG